MNAPDRRTNPDRRVSPAIGQFAIQDAVRLRAINADLLEALQGLLAVNDSVTSGQERELREKWIPKARAAITRATQS